MASVHLKWYWIAGLAVAGLFLFLLSLRIGLLHPPLSKDVHLLSEKTDQTGDRETWMQIFQNGRKIGYAHRILSPGSEGYEFTDDVFMRINSMGVVQGVTFSTRGTLNRDLTVSTFHVRLTSNMFHFAARGACVGKNLTLYAGEPGDEKRYDLVLKDVPHMSGHIADAAIRSGLRAGEVKTFSLFDPAGMGVRPVKVSLLGNETRSVSGKPIKLTKLAVDFVGTRQYAWVDEQGRIMREEGALGLALERATKEEAHQGVTSGDAAGADMTELASVASNLTIREPTALGSLKVKISHVDMQRFILAGGRQSCQDDLLTVQKEVLMKSDKPVHFPAGKGKSELLRSTPFVQSDHPDIRDALRGVISPNDLPGAKMQKIIHWVYRHVEKQPVLSVSNAVETLKYRKGDCTEHAVLVAALGRAAGIPTTIETGLVYQRGRFYYHAWNVFWIDEWQKWITADAVFDQIPADVTHLRFVRGEAQEQLDLIGLLGRIKLEIIE